MGQEVPVLTFDVDTAFSHSVSSRASFPFPGLGFPACVMMDWKAVSE